MKISIKKKEDESVHELAILDDSGNLMTGVKDIVIHIAAGSTDPEIHVQIHDPKLELDIEGVEADITTGRATCHDETEK